MAKDRNTMAKRQREVDKKRKQDDKRDKRTRRKDEPAAPQPVANPVAESEFGRLTDAEINVLGVFRKYLMGPGQMLCLSNTDIDSMKSTLDKLTKAGLLVPEDFKGGYSLTQSGYKAMTEVS
ncbi:MAG: hypothetical protein R3C53_05990 [Pirellulaceae bacterium]